MIIGKVLTVARCGIQMSLQTPSLVLILPSTERQLQLKIKKILYRKAKIENKHPILIHAVHPFCNLFGLFHALGAGVF